MLISAVEIDSGQRTMARESQCWSQHWILEPALELEWGSGYYATKIPTDGMDL